MNVCDCAGVAQSTQQQVAVEQLDSNIHSITAGQLNSWTVEVKVHADNRKRTRRTRTGSTSDGMMKMATMEVEMTATATVTVELGVGGRNLANQAVRPSPSYL